MISYDKKWTWWIMSVTDKSNHIMQHISLEALLAQRPLASLTLWNAAPLSEAFHVIQDGPDWDND